MFSKKITELMKTIEWNDLVATITDRQTALENGRVYSVNQVSNGGSIIDTNNFVIGLLHIYEDTIVVEFHQETQASQVRRVGRDLELIAEHVGSTLMRDPIIQTIPLLTGVTRSVTNTAVFQRFEFTPDWEHPDMAMVKAAGDGALVYLQGKPFIVNHLTGNPLTELGHHYIRKETRNYLSNQLFEDLAKIKYTGGPSPLMSQGGKA